MLVGVGVALARAGRERRAALDARRARRASLFVGEPLAGGLRRVTAGQLELAIELLERYPGESRDRTIHETRKALKRARAIVRFLNRECGGRFARENAALRDCARRLAGARDAAVMLETLDRLGERNPKLVRGKTPRAAGVRALRAQLLVERDAAAASGAGAREEIERCRALAADLRALRARVLAWDLGDGDGEDATAKVVKQGLRGLYRQGRRRGRRARRRPRDVAAVHGWRKSVKDLRYLAETLQRGEVAKPSKDARRLRRVARRADRLGEALGEDHDLALLALAVRARAKRDPAVRPARKALLKAIERRRGQLRKRTRREGERLYSRSPSRFVRRVADLG